MKARLHSPEGQSTAECLQRDRASWAAFVAGLSQEEARDLLHDWGFWSRPKQRTPKGRWFAWLILAGRGFGKTRTAVEFVRDRVTAREAKRIALIGRTAADLRDVMIEGESGILAAFPKRHRPKYEPTKRRITFHTGARATCFSAEEPDQLRGPQHDTAWLDEPAAYPQLAAVWKWLVPAMRLGDPRVVLTTTPRPLPLFTSLLDNPRTVFTTGTTYENSANMPEITIEELTKIYEGTDLGDQEIGGKLLGEMPGALWRAAWIQASRVERIPCEVKKKLIVIDPSSSAKDEACEVGMVVLYLGVDGKVYVVADLSCHASPAEWIAKAAHARKTHEASAILYESNHGGGFIVDLFRITARDEMRFLRSVHAGEDKQTRAQPVSALTQKGFVCMVGRHEKLEAQLTTWIPGKGKSPDRIDALVHGVTDLAIGPVTPSKHRQDPFAYAA